MVHIYTMKYYIAARQKCHISISMFRDRKNVQKKKKSKSENKFCV